jgi:hypothetical protein
VGVEPALSQQLHRYDPRMAQAQDRISSEVLVRLIGGLCGGVIMLTGIVVGSRTDRFWVTFLAILGAAVAGYFAMTAANRRWP